MNTEFVKGLIWKAIIHIPFFSRIFIEGRKSKRKCGKGGGRRGVGGEGIILHAGNVSIGIFFDDMHAHLFMYLSTFMYIFISIPMYVYLYISIYITVHLLIYISVYV